jgi:hypothetical protein
MLTLTQAAKETGLTRSAIFKAIKSGRLSATKNDKGQFCIDPAELFRVYSQVDKVDVSSTQTETPTETAYLKRENEFLRQQVDDLKMDRDQWRRQATMLLSHQPINLTIDPTHGQPEDSMLWKKLFGRK